MVVTGGSGRADLKGRLARTVLDEVIDDARVAAVLLPVRRVDHRQIGWFGLGEGHLGRPATGDDLSGAGSEGAAEPRRHPSVGGTDEHPVTVADDPDGYRPSRRAVTALCNDLYFLRSGDQRR